MSYLNSLEICGIISLVILAAISIRTMYRFISNLYNNLSYAHNVFRNRETYDVQFTIGCRSYTFRDTFYDNPGRALAILYRLAWRELFS